MLRNPRITPSRRSHLINERRWRGELFGLAARREEGACPQRPVTDEQRRSRPKEPPRKSMLLLFNISIFVLSLTPPPLRAFMRWLLEYTPSRLALKGVKLR